MMQPLTKVVKNIIIINVLFYLGTMIYKDVFYDLFAGRWFQSELFRPWQIVTHMFMHGGLSHIAFNMFAVYMFGSTLENYWGSKKFLIFYMLSGVGAFFLYQGVSCIQVHSLLEAVTPEMIEIAKSGRYNPDSEDSIRLARMFYSPLVGASGAVFGLLLGFGSRFSVRTVPSNTTLGYKCTHMYVCAYVRRWKVVGQVDRCLCVHHRAGSFVSCVGGPPGMRCACG